MPPGDQDLPLIVNVGHHATEGGFFSTHCAERTRWEHVSVSKPVGILDFVRKPDLRRVFGCYRAARCAVREQAALVVTHDPRVTFPTGLFLKILGYRGRHLAFSFNYPWLPQGIRRRFHAAGFRAVDRFVVYSTMETRLYQDYFGLAPERLDFIRWGVNPPPLDPADRPVEEGKYICALGENSRDYATLLKAMEALPDIRLVMVVRPHNLVGLTVPKNVTIHTNIPLGRAMNILAFSRFMALPLLHSRVPCGHVTLVNAMHLGKPFVITRSTGVEDYVTDGVNALMCDEKSPEDMARKIRMLWDDPCLCDRLGSAGKALAQEHCTEASTLAYFTGVLERLGVLKHAAN